MFVPYFELFEVPVVDRSVEQLPVFLDSFEKQVDPDGTLEPAERARRAESARKAHFARLALKSAQARRKKSRTAA